MTLPLSLRNGLAELILESLHDAGARRALAELVDFCRGRVCSLMAQGGSARFPRELFDEREGRLTLKGAYGRYKDELCERTLRAWTVVCDRPLAGPEPALGEVLDQAADLHDARLFFEVHELLEPYWVRAEGPEREALQGLIQIAVGFQHLANNNLEGAQMLLEEGKAKAEGKRLEGRDLTGFARAVRTARDTIVTIGPAAPRGFDWETVPRFPRGR